MRLGFISVAAALLTMPLTVLTGGCGRENYDPVGDGGAGASCGQAPRPDTLAHYRMETISTGFLIDDVGGFDAAIFGAPLLGPGPTTCGMALVGQDRTYAVIDHDPRLVGDMGSVDFWIRPGPPPLSGDAAGVLSRDAFGTLEAGHFGLMYTPGGRLVVRMQAMDGDVALCSNLALPPDEWAHVGVNYGPPGLELHINGVRQRGTGTWRFRATTMLENCTTTGSDSFAEGLAGNENPWVIGANSSLSTDGIADTLYGYFLGDIDELRISGIRRDFATR